MGTIARDFLAITGAGNDRVRLEWNDRDKALDVYIEGEKISSWSIDAGIPSGPVGVFKLIQVDKPDVTNQQTQTLFTVNGRVLVTIYGIVTTDIKAQQIAHDCHMTIGYDALPSAFLDDLGTPLGPAGYVEGTLLAGLPSQPPGQVNLFAGTQYLNGQNIKLYKTGVDQLTQGGMTLYAAWQPLIAGAAVEKA